jgi:hypothetical protein
MRRRDGGTDRGGAGDAAAYPGGRVGQFLTPADAAPAGEPRKLAPGRRRGSARDHYESLRGAR